MYTPEELWKKFTWGTSVLVAYFSFNSKENLHDINIFSESFACDLLNIVWGYNAKTLSNPYNPGYDLIDTDSETVFQISADNSPEKVIDSFDSLSRLISKQKAEIKDLNDKIRSAKERIGKQGEEDIGESDEEIRKRIAQYEDTLKKINDIEGYRVRFFFFSKDAKEAKDYSGKDKTGYKIPKSLVFNQTEDILSLGDLPKAVHQFSAFKDNEKLEALESFMRRYDSLFSCSPGLIENKVTKVIKEYSDNFTAALFLHKAMKNTKITLQNTYIEPHYSEIIVSHSNLKSTIDRLSEADSLSTVSLLDTFLWYKDNVRLLFIDGAAAIGKTSFISWLCYHYLHKHESDEGKSIFLQAETKLVVVRLRDLSVAESDSAERSILEYLGIASKKEFEDDYGDCFIVLDGADELSFVGGLGSITIEQFILSIFNAFPHHKIMVTSRPQFIDMTSFTGATRSFSYIHCNIKHFSESDRKNWIEAYEKAGGEILINTKEYLLRIDDKDADGVADTPLALYLLAACDYREEMRDNKWVLFHEIFHNAIRSTDYNSSFQNGYHKKLTNDAFAEKVYETIGEISNKMYQNMKAERYYILSNELDAIIQRLKGDIKDTEAIKKTCVLCAYWKENTNIGALEFYHNDIRDFFLCEYLYKRFNEINFSMSKDDILHSIIKTSCEVFQSGVIANTTWAQAFSFFYKRIKASIGSTTSADLCHYNINGIYKDVIFRLLHESDLWIIASKTTNPYEVIKSIVYNAVLFLRIWGIAISEEVLPLFSEDNTDDQFWLGKGIFYDWDDIFLGEIKISDDLQLSVGSYAIFHNLEFKSSNLHNICFESSTLIDVAFKNTNLTRANFRNSNLTDVEFIKVDLTGVNFSKSNLVNVNLGQSSADLVNCSGAVLENVEWPERGIVNINVSDATIKEVLFSQTKFSDRDFSNSLFDDCKFHNVQFRNIRNAKFVRCAFKNCNFENIDLGSSSDPYCATFIDCNFLSAELKNTMNTPFKGCTFKNCIFERIGSSSFSSKAKLSECTFCGNISNVSFDQVELNDISCIGANLDSTSFRDSTMRKMRFQQAHFGGIQIKDCICKGNFNLYGAEIPVATLKVLMESGAEISGEFKRIP